jgi:hypothetical protein
MAPNTGFDNNPNIVTNIAGNVAGILSTRPNAKFMSGARCTLKVNGQLVGFAFGISWTINTMVTEINTIDDYLPYELAPQRVTVEGTISALHPPGISATTLAWQPDVLSFLFAPYIAIEARDAATNQIIFATDKATIISRTEDIKIDSLSNITLRWRAIGFLDEKTPVTPNNYNQPAPPTSPGGPSAPKTSLVGNDNGSSNLPKVLNANGTPNGNIT